MRYIKISRDSYWVVPTPTITTAGGDGPDNPVHLYAIEKYVKNGWSLLDIGCGTGWTYQAIRNQELNIQYKGVDVLPLQTEYNKLMLPDAEWDTQDGSFLAEDDQSFDVSFSRGVIDYLPSFEQGLREHCRVARKLVIIWFWWGLQAGEDHQIKRMIHGQILFPDYSNKYSEKKVMQEVSKLNDWRIVHSPEKPIEGLNEMHRLLVLERRDA